MNEEREEKSFGELETLRDGGVESVSEGAVSEGAKSIGDWETLRDGEGWGIQEEWGGKRLKPGKEILGRYVMEKELGQGGMGVTMSPKTRDSYVHRQPVSISQQ